MGLGDLINSLLGGAEDLYDKGKKKAGELVDSGTDKLGGALDRVGLHDWADGVEDWGDEVASDLGAMPGEQQLGRTEQADELVHGKPEKIRESAKHLKDFHGAFDKVGSGLKKIDSAGWKGEGGDAFREKFGVHPAKWAHAAEACGAAADALERYADTVTWAQKQAAEAVELYKKGTKAFDDAADEYQKKADAYNAKARAGEDPGTKPVQDTGAGTSNPTITTLRGLDRTQTSCVASESVTRRKCGSMSTTISPQQPNNLLSEPGPINGGTSGSLAQSFKAQVARWKLKRRGNSCRTEPLDSVVSSSVGRAVVSVNRAR
ncbi:putative T7SS-secreted protein [Streptomyces recifensis]|uniref:putative T7SS-secreted protein n=1 Tax=Streptomyces recifensis TaxID=67355 RepID=UPI001FC98006|nr:hypothetical protein [Streptomyces recifensis]